MPRYFFNHRAKDGKREIDIDGLELPSLNKALDEATFAAEAAVSISGTSIEGCFEIEDAGRLLVASVPYASVLPEPESDAPTSALPR